MKVRANLMNADDMNRALKRISHQILERNQGADHIVLLGIKSRGIPLAELLADHLHTIEGVQVPVGQLDITRFRDDRSRSTDQDSSRIPVDITGRHVILVDDVLYTGRTVRAALDAVSAYGRKTREHIVKCRFRIRSCSIHSAGSPHRPGASGASHPCGLCGQKCTHLQI